MASGDWDTYSEHQTSQNNINLEILPPTTLNYPSFCAINFFFISDGRISIKERKCNVIIRKTNKPSMMMITVIRVEWLDLDEVIMLIQ